MDIILKNRFLTIVVAVLICLNISLISFFWYFNQPTKIKNLVNKKSDEINIVEFIKIELDFSEIQSDSLDSMFQNFKYNVKEMKEKIRLMHNRINDQVLNNKKIFEVTNSFDSLGLKKAELDIVSYKFFLDLRSMCNDEQKVKFDEFYSDIIRLINKPK